MNFEVDTIVTFKINSGEELVAKVIEDKDTVVLIDTPLSVTAVPGSQGIGLMPSLFTADDENVVTLNKNSISISSLTGKAVRSKYIEAITGIKLPEKKLILKG